MYQLRRGGVRTMDADDGRWKWTLLHTIRMHTMYMHSLRKFHVVQMLLFASPLVGRSAYCLSRFG